MTTTTPQVATKETLQAGAAATASGPPLPVLTSLRFFAAAEVVLFHFFSPRIPHSSYIWGLVSWGTLSVTFFFILSGFILTYVYWGPAESESAINAPSFWRARLARIAPGYYLGFALAVPGFLYSGLILKTIPHSDLVLGLTLAPLFLQTWSPRASLLINPPSWSLSVECFFYALFPFLVKLLRRVHYLYLLPITYFMVLAVVPFVPTDQHPPGTFQLYAPLYHLPKFLFGIGLGRMYLSLKWSNRAVCKGIFFASAACLLFLFMNRVLLPVWIFGDALQVPLFALLIIGGAGVGKKIGVLSHPFSVLLGEASYAMYILHIPLAFLWSSVTRRLHMSFSMSSECILYFTTVCMLSIASFLYFESPLRRRILGHSAHRAA